MWECHHCKESIKDKYKHCWNCGRPKTLNPEVIPEQPVAPQTIPEPLPAESQLIEENSPGIVEDKQETPLFSDKSQTEEENLFGYKSSSTEVSSKKIGTIIQFCLWLLALAVTIAFAYLSWQKMDNFEKNLTRVAENFNNQKAQFIFPQNIPREKGDKTPIGGNIKGKVLPLNAKNNEVESLYYLLPDDLRPANIEEAQTVLWMDCQNEAVNKYSDGSIGLREKCRVYLVERETGKFIAIQDFLGIMPAISKEKEGKDAIGKVLPDKYISFLKEKQADVDKTAMQISSDSPDHHFFNKSEFYFTVLGLGIIIAIGLGWLVFNLKSNRQTDINY